MSEHAYETPQKRDLREAASVALEQAGFQLLTELATFKLPREFGQAASVVGDFQSINEDGVRLAFYLVVNGQEPLSTWLVNVAQGAHTRDDVNVYVIARDPAQVLVESCRSHGAALFDLRLDRALHLLVDPSEPDPAARKVAIRKRVKNLRRRAKTKLNLNESAIQENYAAVRDIVADISADARADWTKKLEDEGEAWVGWSEHIDALMEDAVTRLNADDFDGCDNLLDAVEALILEGPAELADDA